MKEKIVQTAGRQQLGEFAPMFARLNDDVLFGEVWNEEALDTKTKCIITVVSLMASGIADEVSHSPAEAEDKKNQLFLNQKQLLDTFLEHGAISQVQYDKSLGDLIMKMGIEADGFGSE